MKRIKKLSVLVLVIGLISLAVLGCGEEEAVEEMEEESEATPVEVVEAEKGEVTNFDTVVGRADPYRTVRITPEVQGEVKEVLVETGEEIKAGQQLLQIDREDLEAQVRQARANLRIARNNLEQAQSGAREEEVAQLRSQLEQAEANYNQAEKNYQRQQSLYEQDIISKQQLENSESQYISAKSGYESAKQNLRMAERGAREEELETLRAQIDQAESNLETAERRLEKAQVKAPAAGTVSEVNIEAGEMASTQPAMSLVELGKIKVTAHINERHIPKLDVGDEVTVEFRSLSKSYSGEIAKIAPVTDRERGNYPVEIIIPNQEREIRGGMYSEVEFTAAKTVGEIVLPREAVLIRDGEEYVYLKEDERAVYKKVETGLSDGEKIVIKEGVEVGDQVIVTGNEHVADDELVHTVGQGEM